MGAFDQSSSSSDNAVYVKLLEEDTHPMYNPETHEYDFRVLRVGGWVEKPVAVLNEDASFPASSSTSTEMLTMIGMETLQDNGNLFQGLQSTDIYAIDTSACQSMYPNLVIHDQAVICASGEGQENCNVDSAARLLLSEDRVLIGMASRVSLL